jgi:prepilin-type N-terminal cleavage/methylation domain-containing protein
MCHRHRQRLLSLRHFFGTEVSHAQSRNAFTLVELLVVIMIIAALVGLMLPATCVQSRGQTRDAVCKNNIIQLARAIQLRDQVIGELPGYINSVGIRDTDLQNRASWIVTTLPYVEENQLWDKWIHVAPKYAPVEAFICPSDPAFDPTAPALSYAVNAGYIEHANGKENAHNGLFLDMTRVAEGARAPRDERDVAKLPLQKMSIVYLQSKGDGVARTLMLSENLNALHWGYTLDKDYDETKDRSYHFGFCWEQPSEIAKAEAKETTKRYRRINSRYPEEEIKSFAQMTPDDGFPSSHHPEIVNVAFASGSVQSVHEDIDPLVYAQLMTSNHKLSDLQDADGKAEKELKQPEEGGLVSRD